MRGSLNVSVRKSEMIRINEGNIQILEKLRSIKPYVGSYDEWRKHEAKNIRLKRHITIGGKNHKKNNYVKDFQLKA
jgi:hypothetical protein